MESFLFNLYAIAAAGSALGVVFSQNVARMAFWLIISLGSVAGLFFMLNADFVGATQLLIYVGGTVVLLIFGVMLTSSGPYMVIKSNPAEVLQSALLGLGFLAVVVPTVTSVDWKQNYQTLSEHGVQGASPGFSQQGEGSTSRRLGTALLGVRVDQVSASSAGGHEHSHEHDEAGHSHASNAADHAHSHDHGAVTHTEPASANGYLLPFEIISVHLLVVLIGASYLARAKRRVDAAA